MRGGGVSLVFFMRGGGGVNMQDGAICSVRAPDFYRQKILKMDIMPFNGLNYMQYTYTRSAIGQAKTCSVFSLILVIVSCH